MNNQRFKFVATQRGRCATQYEREDLDSILPRYREFVYRDQNGGLPSKLERKTKERTTKTFGTQLGYGTYGVENDGTLTLLATLIDSSD